MLPVIFPEGGAQTCPSPILDASCVTADAGDNQGALLYTWDSERAAVAPPEVGSTIVDGAARGGKLGAVIAVSPGETREKHVEYSVLLLFFFVTEKVLVRLGMVVE